MGFFFFLSFFLSPRLPAPAPCSAVDIALPAEKIALEVDGPHHFARNTLRPLATLFSRALLLEARGWRVASVPFFAWEGAEEEARRALLRGLLDRARAARQEQPAAAARQQ